ncbi:MAG TPA: hypothetical protein VG713_06705, partial [Pirellulales bacterium]|nr:hypothetical protein [Pirellulales bacterium]
MTRLPRLALGTVQPGADSRIIAWALMNALTRSGYQVQHFHSRCCFGGVEGALASAGLASRHLDSWLMRPELCRELFEHASRECDVSIVEGRYAPAEADASPTLGGQLEPLCQWLGLARVGVLDLSAVQNCRLPPKPRVDALLLDRVRDEDGFYSLQTVVESLWRVPVVGGLEDLADLRAEIDSLPLGSRVGTELCDHLGASLARFTNLDRIAELGRKHELPDFCARPLDHACRSIRPSATTVAMAYDDAFHSHFPDTLDLLEMLGAHVVDFSPLHDESLPLGVDLVYLGCGRPDLYAEQLSNNACMRA